MSISSWVRVGTLSCPDLSCDDRAPPRMASFVSSAPVVGWLQTTHRRHMGSSSMLRWSCRKRAAAGDCLGFGCISAGTFRSPSRGVRMSSSTAAPPPWLMLPPVSGGGDMIYRFYSLAEKKVLYYPKMKTSGAEWPDDDAKFVGSSHGWLALFNQHTNKNLFLSNPISGRHIKLPPHPEMDLKPGRGSVSQVILSCSPEDEEEECRAMMTVGSGHGLAFYSPGCSTQWTPFYEDNKTYFEDFVYSSTQKLLFCLTKYPRKAGLEAWDLGDALSPRIDWMVEDYEMDMEYENYPCFWLTQLTVEDNLGLNENCWQRKYLVFAEQSNQLFLVVRHINPRMRSDGSFVTDIFYGPRKGGWDYSYPYKTIDFHVYKIIREGERGGTMRYMEGDLDGMCMFVGSNHSFAVSASEFPELKLNSIYFTDEDRFIRDDFYTSSYGGHDNGVFDYENRTFSSCYYPCDYQSITRIIPPPMWFTPSPNKS